MSATNPTQPDAPTDSAPATSEPPAAPTPAPAPAGALAALPVSEGAVTNRIVVMLAPFITIAAAWIAGLVARHVPGVKLDQTQVASVMVSIVVVCLGAAWKWLQGWQQHELLVAQGAAAPVKPVVGPAPTRR